MDDGSQLASWRNGSVLVSGASGSGFESQARRFFASYNCNLFVTWESVYAPTVPPTSIYVMVRHLDGMYGAVCDDPRSSKFVVVSLLT